jgi:L-ascorbate metabolism protein UlaG (beta-lactamase superfamily)
MSGQMHFHKLNDDSSWIWTLNGKRYLVDPWFTPSQVDLHPWFSEQFHVTKQPLMDELGDIDFIFVSHPFTDHCNKETLLQLDASIPVIADRAVKNKIAKLGHFKTVRSLEDAEITIEKIGSGSFLDPVHNAFVFLSEAGKLLYAPHGSRVKSLPKVDVVISTTTLYKLPFWIGGTINLGLANAQQLKDLTSASIVIATHDEQKIGKGLVEKLARKKYDDLNNLSSIRKLNAGESFVFPFDSE